LIQSLVLFLLLPDVLSDDRLITPHRRDEVPSCPEVLPYEVALALPIDSGDMNGALPFDETHHLRHRVLRRYRHQHMNVVSHHVPFFDRRLLLRCQFPEYLPKMLPQLPVQHFPTTLGDEHDMIFALPRRVAQTLELVHRGLLSSRVLGGSRGKFPRWTLPETSNGYCHPGRAGGTP